MATYLAANEQPADDRDMTNFDVIIIGGGIAGLAAGNTLARMQRRVAIVDAGQPRNRYADGIHNYPTREGTDPMELQHLARLEFEAYGGTFIEGEARSVSEGFHVELVNDKRLSARRLLLTTSLTDTNPGIPGHDELWGTHVLHCPFCHGYEVRGQRLGVINLDPRSAHPALMLTSLSDDIIYFSNERETDGEMVARLVALGVQIERRPVKRYVLEGHRLRGVEVEGGAVIERDAVFAGAMSALRPNSSLLTQLGCAVDEGGYAVVDATGKTSVEGVWAAGNIVNPSATLLVAASSAMQAGAMMHLDLAMEDSNRISV